MKLIVKYFIGCFTLMFILKNGHAQDVTSDIIYLSQLPQEGILLNVNWKLHDGDNLTWKEKSFNDSNWSTINPTKEIPELPQIKNHPIGWLRLKLTVDSNLLNKPLAFQVYQTVASEIYLNGELLKKYGVVSADEKKIKAINPLNIPEGFQFTVTQNILAVRFSFQKNLPYTKNTQSYSLIKFRINEVERAYKFTQHRRFLPWLNSIYTGFFLILTLIHLGLFFISKKQKANLYFSVSTLSIAIANFLYIILLHTQDIKARAYGFFIDWIFLLNLYNLFLYLAFNDLFKQRKSFYFWLLCTATMASPLCTLWIYRWGEIINTFLSFFLCTAGSLSIAIKAYRKGYKYSGIIVSSVTLYFIIYSIFLLIYFGVFNDHMIGLGSNFTFIDLMYHVSVIALPVSLSLYLSLDFARTSKELENKLEEVKILSAKTLQQELEKQRADLENQQAIELERMRISAELHDDVGATLSSVKAYAEILKDNPGNPLIAELIKDNSTEMIERLEVIAWATNPRHDNFKSLEGRMIKFAAPLCHSKNIQCNIESTGINEEMMMHGEMRQNLYLVFKEAINNMMKYSEATTCSTSIFIHHNQFVMQITDNGKGFDGTIKGTGSGWKNMQKRTNDLNGKLDIQSMPGKGTVITMSLPYPFKIPNSWDGNKN